MSTKSPVPQKLNIGIIPESNGMKGQNAQTKPSKRLVEKFPLANLN
jgi:hypothetical protein